MQTKNYAFNILKFWRYKSGRGLDVSQDLLSGILDVPRASVFMLENGRTAEYLFLKSLCLKKGAKVAVQGFTCNAVVNPVLWLGLDPLYIDIDSETLNISLDDLYNKIDDGVKVVVLQHTFGNPVFSKKEELESFIKDMHSRDIIVFEDCAHSLGGSLDGKALGTFGDAALFSFGIEKVLSSRVGGALVVNNERYLNSVVEVFNSLKPVGYWGSFVWLLNPIIWRFIRRFENSNSLAFFLRKVGLLNMGFHDDELVGKKPRYYPRRISNVLAEVLNEEMGSLDANLNHRKNISQVYSKCLANLDKISLCPSTISYVRYPVVCKTEEIRDSLLNFLREKGVNVGDWYNPVIYPSSTNMRSMRYGSGMCKRAEDISLRILNLPTGCSVSVEYAKEICGFINLFFEKHENN